MVLGDFAFFNCVMSALSYTSFHEIPANNVLFPAKSIEKKRKKKIIIFTFVRSLATEFSRIKFNLCSKE